MKARIKVDMTPMNTILTGLGVTHDGDVQAQATKIVMHRITRYMPYRSGALSTKLKFMKSPTEIEVSGPYAHFQYEGKVWIYPPTGSTWAPKYGRKIKTNRDLDQKTGTKNDRAGSHWDRRLVAAEGAAMQADLQAYIDRRAGKMTALEKITGFVGSYPGADILQTFRVDYTDQIPANGGIFPSGLVEISRKTDLFGNVTVTNQYNFGLYYVLEKAPGDDAGAAANADWLMDFQEWIQAQSVSGQAPIFGDVPCRERIAAQNGVLYDARDEGLAVYTVQLSVQFVKEYKTTNPWFL